MIVLHGEHDRIHVVIREDIHVTAAADQQLDHSVVAVESRVMDRTVA